MSSVPENAPQSRKSPVTLVYQRGGRTRTLRLDTKVALAVGIALVVLGVWYLVATIYLVFRDDLLSSLVARHTQVQYAYEDRIAALRTSIDRLTSRQLIDQDGVEGKVQELMSRQAQLETRQAMVAALASHAESMPRLASMGAPSAVPPASGRSTPAPSALGGPLPAPEMPAGAATFAPVAKPHPVSEFGPLRGSGAAAAPARAATPAQAPPVRPTPAASGDPDAVPTEGGGPTQQRQRQGALPSNGAQPVAARLLRMAAAQSIAENRQLATLDAYAHRFRATSSRLQGVLVDVGLDTGRFAGLTGLSGGTAAHQGGPFVPVKVDPSSGPFEASVDRVQRSMVEADKLQRIVDSLPLRRPLPGDSETTSHFGYRADPFTRTMAMHTGIDFRDDFGAAIRATAGGVVVTAEYSGGYGNMVEIDHGNGLTTRYAHLSQILVSEGQKVAGGSIVGRLGSTGRSTGPHLHYETRVDGDPVDPMRYLRAASRLGRS